MLIDNKPADENSPHGKKTPLSVTELTARIKQMLEIGFARVEVTGEVSRLTRPASGHLYFTIKDAHAAISAVIWRSTAMRLQQMPEEGEAFVFSGHLSLYEPRGSYQLVVSRVEAAGAGKLAAEFERRKRSFAQLGWFDTERKQSIPPLPNHIGIVTSATAAAFEDVKKVLVTRPAWLQLTLAPALVQGQSAPASIASAIKKITDVSSPPDVILLVRGGGSIEDLWCFNAENVVKAVVDCPIPIISGIGHEIDTTLADLAADVRAATPSNAAEICCPSSEELRKQLPKLASLRHTLRQQFEHQRQLLTSLLQRQSHIWQRRTDARHHHVNQLHSRLDHASHVNLKQMNIPLRRLEKRLIPLQPVQRLQQQRLLQASETSLLHQNMYILLQQRQRSLTGIATRLSTQQQHIRSKRQQLLVLHGKLKELDPTQVLERGYSMALDANGQLITSIDRLATGDKMQVRFRDGTASTTVDAVAPSSKPA
jgi:exodeoxyribonuclease VII large subunit